FNQLAISRRGASSSPGNIAKRGLHLLGLHLAALRLQPQIRSLPRHAAADKCDEGFQLAENARECAHLHLLVVDRAVGGTSGDIREDKLTPAEGSAGHNAGEAGTDGPEASVSWPELHALLAERLQDGNRAA